MPFHSLGLDPRLLQSVAAQGYTLATPIQKKTIPQTKKKKTPQHPNPKRLRPAKKKKTTTK